MQLRSVGIDLGKMTFHFVALGASGKVLVKKKVHAEEVVDIYSEHADLADRLEACSGVHFLGRALRKRGRDVRLIAAQFVKPHKIDIAEMAGYQSVRA